MVKQSRFLSVGFLIALLVSVQCSKNSSTFNHEGCFSFTDVDGVVQYYSETKNPDGTYRFEETDTDANGNQVAHYIGQATISNGTEIDKILSGDGAGSIITYTFTTPDADTIIYTVVSDTSNASEPGDVLTFKRVSCR